MESQDNRSGYNKGNESRTPQRSSGPVSGRAWGGIIIVVVGTIILLGRMDLPLPNWLYSWPMILIAVGLFIGVRHSFRNPAWIIMLVIGGIFLTGEIIEDQAIHRFFWPVAIIAFGLIMILRPRRSRGDKFWKDWDEGVNDSNERLDSVSIFGGAKKHIISKDFKGGEMTNIFGGTDLNLHQADIHGKVIVEVTNIFGGTKFVVPPHWSVRYDEVVTIFGGLDDKRLIAPGTAADENKILVIKGTCIFGGIDIKTY